MNDEKKIMNGDVNGPYPDMWRCEVVVDSSQVKQYNDLGFRTISVHEEDIRELVTLQDQVVPAGMSYSVCASHQELAKCKVLRFLMVKDGASRIAEIAASLESAKTERDRTLSSVAMHEKTIAQLKTANDALTQDIERRRVLLEKEKEEAAKLRSRFSVMEADVAKFRKEIGEQRWREITAGGGSDGGSPGGTFGGVSAAHSAGGGSGARS
jgi:hypothetical protein